MKVKDVIEIVENNSFYSISDVDEYIMDNYCEALKPLYTTDKNVQYLMNVNINTEAYFITVTILYQCDDGVVGINGLYCNFIESVSNEDQEYICTAKEYILENRPTWIQK